MSDIYKSDCKYAGGNRRRSPRKGAVVESYDRQFILGRSTPDEETGCWNWNGYKTPRGYGTVTVAPGFTVRAHRLSYAIFKMPIPQGLLVCHACDNPACVNPSHIWVGTVKDNALDMVRKGRHVPRKAVGIKGEK